MDCLVCAQPLPALPWPANGIYNRFSPCPVGERKYRGANREVGQGRGLSEEIGTLAHWNTGTLKNRNTGSLEKTISFGTLELRNA